MAEAIVVFREDLAEALDYRSKRAGQIISKGRLIGAQFEGYFAGGHWLDNARHANAMAAMLSEGLLRLPGVRLAWPTQANEVFPIIPRTLDEALKAAVELSARYINDRKLPDKAIDVIDETGASQMLLLPEERKTLIDVPEIEATIATMARIPPKSVSKSDTEMLQSLEVDLKRVVFGQDAAISALASAIKLARAGLREPEKPIGSYLFTGPTGVGKTEVAKQLADTLGVELLRFDMSEYMERHTVSRLIGAPPGYVGFDQGGLLTEAIVKHPHAVLLMDEIEKAHPDVFNILLQVMDRGTLTDTNGREANFKNVIIVMTTNAGAFEMNRASIGFVQADNTSDGSEAIKRLFSPEFRNRIDAIIQFAPLDMPVIERVVDKLLLEIEAQLEKKGVSIVLDDAARRWLAEKGYDPKMGARPMARLLQDQIKRPLAEELLFGKLASGGTVKIGLTDDGKELKLTTLPAETPALPATLQ